MEIYARIRPRLAVLTLPMIWLFLISATVSFISCYKLDAWQFYTLWTTAAVAGIFLWLVPVLKYVSKFIDITSDGILVRTGLGSSRVHDLPWSSIASVTASVGSLTISSKEGAILRVRGYASAKNIAREIQSRL